MSNQDIFFSLQLKVTQGFLPKAINAFVFKKYFSKRIELNFIHTYTTPITVHFRSTI